MHDVPDTESFEDDASQFMTNTIGSATANYNYGNHVPRPNNDWEPKTTNKHRETAKNLHPPPSKMCQ